MKDNSTSLKYKYIVVGYGYDYYKYVYRQLTDLPNTIFIHNWPASKVLAKIYNSLSFRNPLINKLWVIIYVNSLTRIAKSQNFSQKDKICFLLLAGGANNSLLDYGLCEKIRKTFVKCKVVYFMNDLISKTRQPVYSIKEHADLVYSFDPGDCRKFGLLNHVIPYSNYSFPKTDNPKYDLAFVGAAKDRVKELLAIYFCLSGKGVKCHFIIIGVPVGEQVYAEGISYRGRISYEENLSILQECNCILDVIQGESSGNTIRVGEAIIMGKKLLTNNRNTPFNGVYDEKYMRVFENYEDIDVSFLSERIPVCYAIKEKMYPVDLLSCIENEITDKQV